LKPLRLAALRVERLVRWKGERGPERWRRPFGGFYWGESLGGPEIPREQMALTWTNHLGGREGRGFFGGRKPLERRYKAGRFCREAQGRKV